MQALRARVLQALHEAIQAGGATDQTLSERSWEQKVLFWRTSLKTWCEDPAVDFEVSHHEIGVNPDFLAVDDQPMVLRGASRQVVDGGEGPAKAAAASEGSGGLRVLSAIWPRTGSQVWELRLQSLLPNWRGAPDLADEACKNAYGEGVGPKPWQEEARS